MERALICPQCNSPLTAHPLARSTVCAYCGTTVILVEEAISVQQFHDAFSAWNMPLRYGINNWCAIDDRYWAIENLIGQGEYFDVYAGRLARWPSELVVIKILRDENAISLYENEWESINSLMKSQVNGSEFYTTLLPQPVLHGRIATGTFIGKMANIYRWQSGFKNNLLEVKQVYPHGVEPRQIIWVWRRILEMLNFIHLSGYVHGNVELSNLLIQENEHGIRLVAFAHAGKANESLKSNLDGIWHKLNGQKYATRQMDLIMSAKCMVELLGGDREKGNLPSRVPTPLANIVTRLAAADEISARDENAWQIREELGRIADQVYGPPIFCPISMPQKKY